MSTNGKDDLLAQIWQISTTLTEEAMAVAAAKGKKWALTRPVVWFPCPRPS